MRIASGVSGGLISSLVLAVFLGCSPSGSSGTSVSTSGGSSGSRVKLQGSGASFPAPLYGRWFKSFSQARDGITVDYQAKGSGAGIEDLTNKMVDFAASDAAMTDEEIAKVDVGVVLLPVTAGKIILAYNLPDGPAELKLSREAYANIFLGKFSKWNDPAIVKCNADAKLPDTNITVVRRSDSSGTTFVFTQHLSAIGEDWKNGPGTGKTVNWPGDNRFVAAPKNDGVTVTIRQTPGAIGYIEYGFAVQTKTPMARLENRAGQFVQPTDASAFATLASCELPGNLHAFFPDPEGDASYRIRL